MPDAILDAVDSFLTASSLATRSRMAHAMRKAVVESSFFANCEQALQALIDGGRPEDQGLIAMLTLEIDGIKDATVTLPPLVEDVIEAIRAQYGDTIADAIIEAFEAIGA